MKVAFCTTCKGRAYHIKQTLRKNIEDNLDTDCIFILLDYNSQDDLAAYIQTNFQDVITSGKLIYYKFNDAPTFKMAHAKNMAHRCAMREGADILVNLDADNFTGYGFATYIEEAFTRTKFDSQEIFMWARMIKGVLAKGISGRIVVNKNAFLITGGYDEQYETHSPDDKDFNARLRRLGYCAQEIDPKFLLAINHNDKTRFKEYPQAQFVTRHEYDISQVTRVVNFGNVGCGTVFRNFETTPIAIAKVPTRIFGIGMHKTATTSLAAALDILGYKSGHWENAHWGKAVWSDMSNLGRFIPMERFYAITDSPIPQFYKELDSNYPNSKFILTIRNEEHWLKSIRNHFDYTKNPYRKQWDRDPFTHKMHTLIYGRKKFDLEVMATKYNQHNQEVMEYFKDRPNDLLIMNMSASAGWVELCGFLGLPMSMSMPTVPYPVEFITGNTPCPNYY